MMEGMMAKLRCAILAGRPTGTCLLSCSCNNADGRMWRGNDGQP